MYTYIMSTPVRTFDDFAVVVGNYISVAECMTGKMNNYDRNHLKEIVNGCFTQRTRYKFITFLHFTACFSFFYFFSSSFILFF